MRKDKKVILYLLDIFPSVSETFILNEILELEKREFNVIIFARKKEDGLRHGLLNDLKAEVFYLSDAHKILRGEMFFSHLKMFILYPAGYLKTFIFSLKNRDKALFWFFKIACCYADLARKYNISHIHSHFASMSSCYAMLIGRMLGRPYTFTVHGIYDLYISPPVDMKERADLAKRVVTISNYNKRYMVKKFNIPDERIEVVHSGIDLDFFNKSRGDTAREKIILSVARLDPVKSLDTLIKACGILDKEHIDFECLIIGEGKSRKKLENLVVKLKLKNKVRLPGAKKIEDVGGYYKKAAIFVLPSKEETMGLSTIEAMASGLPVISTNIYGIPELVEHGVNGYLINPGDTKRLAGYLKELLGNENKRDEMGRLGRKKIDNDFNLKKEVSKLVEVFYGKSQRDNTCL